ncbi:nitrile hydratase subunit alpha [Granulosicoccus sp. 3-233]|uniref:nitrile hydratase subunit alpha n=1 Tax=Granulosicoccus sp. 3-233 TaxID=3417969 RepID=UPI003D34EC9E
MTSLYPGFRYDADKEVISEARAKALESLLIEKGVITGKTVDKVLGYFDTEMGPFNGAKLVARAWVDPEFKQLLLEDCNAACKQLDLPNGMSGAEGEHMRIVENTPDVHNVVVCTLCSCYPWPTLGLPPYWFKDPTFRARVVREPRVVLNEFGVQLDDSVNVRIWDSSAQIRWWVLPMRPEGTEDLGEEELASLLTPEAMMGVALVRAPSE